MTNDQLSRQLQRELNTLEESFKRGDMTLTQYNNACVEVERQAREIAREEAQRAYDNEMDNA